MTNKFLKFGAVAACIALVVCIGVGIIPMLNKDDGGGQDESHAVFFGSFLYKPIAVGDHVEYPAIKELMVGATGENRYDIREEHLGEYIGVFPGDESLGIPEGAAYRFAAYPNYDSVIIVERDGKYNFYISDGNVLSDGVPRDSGSALAAHGLPESVLELCTGHFEPLLDNGIAPELFAALDGETNVPREQIEKMKYDAWREIYGESGVFFDGKTFSYDGAESYQKFTDFVNKDLHSLWIKTDKGFGNLLLLVDLKLGYFTFCGNCYLISAEECETVSELLSIE